MYGKYMEFCASAACVQWLACRAIAASAELLVVAEVDLLDCDSAGTVRGG